MDDFPRFDLNGQIALVTGAARGLGRAISLALAHAGADVALGLRDAATGGTLVREIEAMGRRALPLAMDVTDLGQITAAVDKAASYFGRIDILVNNAGLGPGEPRRESQRSRLRPDGRGEPEGDVLRQPGGWGAS